MRMLLLAIATAAQRTRALCELPPDVPSVEGFEPFMQDALQRVRAAAQHIWDALTRLGVWTFCRPA